MRYRHVAARLTVWIYALASLTCFIDWFTHRVFFSSRRGQMSFAEIIFSFIGIPARASWLSGLIVGMIALGLIRHKRVALYSVAFFQVSAIVSSIMVLVSFEQWTSVELTAFHISIFISSIVFNSAVVIMCLWLRPLFPARVAPGSWTSSIAILVLGVLISTAIANILLAMYPGRSGAHHLQLIAIVLKALSIVPPPSWHVSIPQHLPHTVTVLFGITLLLAILAFLRSSDVEDEWSVQAEIDARRLIADFNDNDSLAYLAPRRDKLLHFSADRKAAVAYQIFEGVCLASGDPIGDERSWPDAVRSWQSVAHSYGWIPAVLACSEKGARCYSSVLHFDILRLGDEAVLIPDQFSLERPAMVHVKRTVRKIRREGFTCTIRRQDEVESVQLEEVYRQAELWRHGKVERGYSMALGRFNDPSDPRVVIVEARDSSHTLVALMTFVPWGRNGLSLDLMRRSPKAPNGINEFIVSELMTWSSTHAVTKVSLNFSFLRHVFAEAEMVSASAFTKMNSKFLGAFDRFWQLQRLYRANAKYLPRWQSRYVAISSAITLPAVAFASAIAEGFLPLLVSRNPHSNRRLFGDDLDKVIAIESPPPPTQEWNSVNDQQRQRAKHAQELALHGYRVNPVGRREGIPLKDIDDPFSACSSHPLIGRIKKIRDHGSVCFIDLVDGEHSVQIIAESERLGKRNLDIFSRLLDSGDLIEIRATAGYSLNGTPSLLIDSWQILAKAYQPIAWDGLDDPQTRLRHRSLDLLVHPDQLALLQARSRAIAAVRSTLTDHHFTEVETPILQTVHGGATARPFRTHINAYRMDLVARIAPELALKKLVIAGMGPIFEIGRNFRNEGADSTHNPEFTVVEAYQPFADYHDMRLLTQEIICAAARAVHGQCVMPLRTADGSSELRDISQPWPVITVCDAVSSALGTTVDLTTDIEQLIEHARMHDIALRAEWGPGAIIEQLYSELVEPSTIEPTFYIDFPAETSPLTAPHRHVDGLVERWDLVANGMELGTAYSELTDPIEQRRRFIEQSWKAANGDSEAMEIDESFLSALELGMPPTGGLGIGLDRLVMALSGTSIRQVLAFPFVRPR